MGRAAGSGGHYEFRLYNKSNGKYNKDVTINLTSVTTVIGATLAKPRLVDWAYRQTVDSVVGLIDTAMHNRHEFSVFTEDDNLMSTMTDGDILDEWLKQNKMRPTDIKDEAGERGSSEHDFLERLGHIALQGDDEDADIEAQKALDNPRASMYTKATARWWLIRMPVVVASEMFLMSLQHGYAGTVDLIYKADNKLIVMDLKSRKAGAGIYESDHIQCGAYATAYEEMTGQYVDETRVLVIRADGTWEEETSPYDPDIFLDLLNVYNNLHGKGN